MFLVNSNSIVGEFGRYGLSELANNQKCKMTLYHERPGSKAFGLSFNDKILTIKVDGYYRLFVSVNNAGNWDKGWIALFLKKNDSHWLVDA